MTAVEPQGFLEDDANVERLCAIGGVSRAGDYRHFGPHPPQREDADLRDLIQRIALENRHYGYRRIAFELRRKGLIVNAKRVLRLTREDNLLALGRRPFVPQTTMSRHPFDIAPNLTRGLKPTGLDQIWVADITYVRLAEGFVYLAAILDAFSRKVVGWALADHLEASLAIEALDMALDARDPAPDSLIHHSDRGVQYASLAYLARLKERKVAVSMSRPANPYDNAKAESFIKLHEDAETRGGQREGLRRPRRRPPPDRRLHRTRLQRQAPALGARLQAPGRVRSRTSPGQPQPSKPEGRPVTELIVSQRRGALHD
jgi:putative transposase